MVVEKVNDTELRFKHPERLLLVVIAFAFWGVGFIDLLGHTSAEPEIFDRYSLPFFILIILYGCSNVVWIVLFFNSNLLSRVSRVVGDIQSRKQLVFAAFIGIGFAFWIIFEWDRWTRLPGLQFAAFGLLLLIFLILLFANWNENRGMQPWRRWIAYPLLILLVLEVCIQVMAWMGVLPGVQRIGGNFYPYERIYYNAEGYRNGFANRNGWTYPDAIIEDDKKSFLIVGGSFVQALQVLPEEQLGVQLTELINKGKLDVDARTEVISIGLPGFGLSPFLFDDVIEPPNLVNYGELIIFFHLGDDFQSPSPSHNAITYTLNGDGKAEVHPNDARLRHDLTHYYLRSVISFQLVETIRSNYLTPKVVTNLFRNWVGSPPLYNGDGEYEGPDFSRLKGYVVDEYDLTEPGHASIKSTDQELIRKGNNFMFTQGDSAEFGEAIAIADSILGRAQEIALANNITIRLVTIPVFPDAFYRTYPSGTWEPQFEEYDLFLPEEALIEIANNHSIPILPMGQRIIADQLRVEEIKSLFFSNGLGNFTPEGHKYFAESINSCFYAEVTDQFCVQYVK